MTRRARVELDELLAASQARLAADPHELAAIARGQLAGDLRTLARVERQLSGGVYLRGPRKGQALDRDSRSRLEAHATALRAAIAHNRGRVACVERGRHVAAPGPTA